MVRFIIKRRRTDNISGAIAENDYITFDADLPDLEKSSGVDMEKTVAMFVNLSDVS